MSLTCESLELGPHVGGTVDADDDEVARHRKAIAITAAGLKKTLPRVKGLRLESAVASMSGPGDVPLRV